MEKSFERFNSKNSIAKSVLMSIVINGLIPMLVYKFLTNYYSSLVSLIIATSIPLLDNLCSIITQKKIDVFAMFMLVGFVLSITAFFLGGNDRLILLRESFVTGIMGIIFIISLLFPKPIVYYFALRFIADPTKKSKIESNWQYPSVRSIYRLMSAMWGVMLLIEALLKTYLVYHLSIMAFLAVSPFVLYGIIGIAIVFTIAFQKQLKKNMAIIRQQG